MTQTHDEAFDKASNVDLITDALSKAGKSAEEIASVSAVDRAQTEADSLRQTRGALQEALLSDSLPVKLFACQAQTSALSDSLAATVLEKSIKIAVGHRDAGSLFGKDGKVNPRVIAELGNAGYWGLPVPVEWGGSGASKFFLGRAMIRMGAEGAEILGGLLSIERLIGAAGPLIFRGNAEQKSEFLTQLARGKLRSGFAGTERYVGCNITKVRTYGLEDGDDIVVYGDKLFISNAWYGHLVALFLRVNDELKVLITQLPEKDTEEFQIVHYGIHALRQIHNKGLKFNGLRVPKKNLLAGDGLAIIFHDLDDGRFAVAATAACRMRRILASCIPWVNFRVTFGEKLREREYIRYLIALQAAYIAGADALIDWSASLIDAGYQGDVSSMIAKTRCTDWLRQCTTELGMFTHGGRFVLHGHTIGDNLADDLVSCVYEGPNPMLGKACIKALAKALGEEHLKPLLVELASAGVEVSKLRLNSLSGLFSSLRYLYAQRAGLKEKRKPILIKVKALAGFLLSIAGKRKIGARSMIPGLDARFAEHLAFAEKAWLKWRKNFIGSVLVYREKLADEDLMMLDGMYEPLTNIVAMLSAICAARQAMWHNDEATVSALNLLCLELRCKLSGEKRTSRRYKKAVHETALYVLEGKFRQLGGVPKAEILQSYSEGVTD
ncbi:MAG TPA: acyl-CoA dehydrogenase family protein [Candidatus Obscuribacterales bacterium]